MPVVKKIPRHELREIRDHRDNTAGVLIKGYTLSQLSVMDGIDTRTIKASWKYLPIRVDNSLSIHRYNKGMLKKPYRILWVRLDEVRDLFNRKTGKKLEVEYN